MTNKVPSSNASRDPRSDKPGVQADERGRTTDLLSFIDASPSPYHVCETAAERLRSAGFTPRPETERWDAAPGRYFTIRGGSIVAWTEPGSDPAAPFTILGAHTDSPNLRIKPLPDTGSVGLRQLGVEIYGGVLLNSWLDRDLGISGRVDLVDGQAFTVRVDRPILRIPQLAIHLDRDIRTNGLLLNQQQHLRPIWGQEGTSSGTFTEMLAGEIGCPAGDILTWDLMTHDLTPSTICGSDDSLIAAPRLDNQLSCWATIEALIAAAESDRRAMVCLFDHEEVGSTSSSGADSAMLPTIVERIVTASGGTREDLHVSMAHSLCVSTDGAHATHPNYADRHDPEHHISLNGGPVVKINANERYATNAHSHAAFITACNDVGVPYQRFVSRSDMPCGSTIGPITSARLGVQTVDAGIAQFAMHSARETAGAFDPPMFERVLTHLLS